MSSSEFLTVDELAEITGRKLPCGQRAWLDFNRWPYVINAAGRPIVGRFFARMMLSGLRPSVGDFQSFAQPDFSVLESF
jgi:hypothetical protein